MRRTPASSVATLALVAVAWASPGHGEKPELPFVPAEAPAGGLLQLRGRTWTDETVDYAIHAQRIDEAERGAYLNHVTGLDTDPFGAPPGETLRFESFVVEIENRGKTQLALNPRAAWLVTDNNQQFPYTLDDLRFAYLTAGRQIPETYARAADALFDTPIAIEPGESVAGLLIYRAVSQRAKRMRLEFSLTLPTGDIVRFSAPYRRLTRKEVKEEP